MLSQKQRERLIARLCAPVETFELEGDAIDNSVGTLVHQDNGSNVLAVAHLDYVGFQWPSFSRKGVHVRCMQLDDRLGVWMILDYLKSLGLNYDILLCDCEEQGRSTAEWFIAHKQYNWAFEFDRAGTDYVLYQYNDTNWEAALDEFFPRKGVGAFSDISSLDCQCCAVNIGIGYHRQHTEQCYADLSQTLSMASRFADFYWKYRDVPFPFEDIGYGWERYMPSAYRWERYMPSAYRWEDEDEREAYRDRLWENDDPLEVSDTDDGSITYNEFVCDEECLFCQDTPTAYCADPVDAYLCDVCAEWIHTINPPEMKGTADV